MDRRLVSFLKKKETGSFSLLLDTSKDNSLQQYLLVYIRTLEHNMPAQYFYKLIPLEGAENAANLYNLLVAQFRVNELVDAIKSRLIGFASDGASVMVGPKSGLATRLEAYTEAKLFRIHCMSHRLHLAIRPAFESTEIKGLIEEFECTLNELYWFYHASPKKNHNSKKYGCCT